MEGTKETTQEERVWKEITTAEETTVALSDVPVEILVQIFDEVEDPLALWTLRCTCKVFNNIIASFPVLGICVLPFINSPCSLICGILQDQNGGHTKES